MYQGSSRIIYGIFGYPGEEGTKTGHTPDMKMSSNIDPNTSNHTQCFYMLLSLN
jgi:hypothetical protein